MKFRILTYMTVFTGLAMPIRLAAQVQQGQNQNQVHIGSAHRGGNMNSRILSCITWLGLFAALAAIPFRLTAQYQSEHHKKQTHYTLRALPTLGGSCCTFVNVNNRDWVTFPSNLAGDQNVHPALWVDGQLTDLGTLGGPNSGMGNANDHGDVAVGGSDTGVADPLGEDFCHFGTHQTCLSFVWHNGRRTLIPTLGGNNNDVSGITNHGQVLVAIGETAFHDPTCTAPQVLGVQGYIWDPDTGEIQRFSPLAGYSVSASFDLNNHGQAVGASGLCSDLTTGGPSETTLWQDGKPIDLGNLGGTTNNVANSINSRGEVVGQSDLAGDRTSHAFLWQHGVMTDLGTLPGDFFSTANQINDKGQVVGQSCDVQFNCRATIWQDGVIMDLNTLIPPNSPLVLLYAAGINARGQIVGPALDQTGAVVPFLATPCDAMPAGSEGCDDKAWSGFDAQGPSERPKVILPESVREQLRTRRGFGQFVKHGR